MEYGGAIRRIQGIAQGMQSQGIREFYRECLSCSGKAISRSQGFHRE
jgi:hypothetical protein